MHAVVMVTVNHDGRGGTAPDPLLDQGGPRKARKIDIRVIVVLASLSGPPGFLGGPWMQVHGLLVLILLPGLTVLAFSAMFTAFLGTLHWPMGSDRRGPFGGFFFGTSCPFRAMGWTSVAQ